MSSRQTNSNGTTDLRRVADAVRAHDRFLITTHENPDGDSLGSILAMKLALEQLGKEGVLYLSGDTPLPTEYRFMALEGLRRTLPDDAAERVVLALDCANKRRIGPDETLLDRSPLVTDTGRFQYANTTPKTLRVAAELVECGADVHRVFQVVYENVAFAKLKLLARALEHARVYEGGRMIVSHLERSDFEAAGAEEPFSEGIIDYLRAVEGAEIAALIREPLSQNGPSRRVSLRTRAEEIDVSAIARKSGGGGHRQAAGFSSESSVEEITDFVRREFLAQTNAK
jgi:phosphoesterase RecJ-like protein